MTLEEEYCNTSDIRQVNRLETSPNLFRELDLEKRIH
jgi:hypothetical protein